MMIGGAGGGKDSLVRQIADAGFDVACIIVGPQTFDYIAEELSEIAARSEQGKVMTKAHPLVGMEILCDRKGTFDWSKIFAVLLDKNTVPRRLVMVEEATARMTGLVQ